MSVARAPLTLIFVFHAIAIAGNQLPRDSALGSWFARATSSYMAVTGSWQSWDMFDSAPSYHAYRVELVGRFPNGDTREFSPLLPDLTPQSTYVRDSTFFLRAIGGSYASYLDGYAQHGCDAVEVSAGTRPIDVFLRQHVEGLRSLADIRNDGAIGQVTTIDTSPVLCRPRSQPD